MEPFTLDRTFHKESVIDGYHSIIWTERYYGDSGVELVVPATRDMIARLPEGVFLGVDGSDEIMMLETRTFEDDGKMKLVGSSLLPWLNNRFIRTTANHEDRYWYISGHTAGATLAYIVEQMCVAGSPYLNGSMSTGIDDPWLLAIPGLSIIEYDDSGDDISAGVPFGPVYDATKEIATTYKIGMKITLDNVTDTDFILGFRSYRGLDRTSLQTVNQVVRFSPQTDTFDGIKELQSIAAYKTVVYAFAPINPDGLATVPGKAYVVGGLPLSGFDVRAMQIFVEDITTDQVDSSVENMADVLNSRAADAITNNKWIKAVDGELVPNNQYKYGIHYLLGDVVEVQGHTQTIQAARVIEYIRSQDATGSREYPTLETEGDIVFQPLRTLSGIFIAGEE